MRTLRGQVNSVSYLIKIITVIKTSKTNFLKKLSACYVNKMEMHCFRIRYIPLA